MAPRTSADRIATVFPNGKILKDSAKYRLSTSDLSYKKIFDAFVLLMDDLQESKMFINSNIDLVPSKLFLR